MHNTKFEMSVQSYLTDLLPVCIKNLGAGTLSKCLYLNTLVEEC